MNTRVYIVKACLYIEIDFQIWNKMYTYLSVLLLLFRFDHPVCLEKSEARVMFGLSYNLDPDSTKLCPLRYSIARLYVSINSYTQLH